MSEKIMYHEFSTADQNENSGIRFDLGA